MSTAPDILGEPLAITEVARLLGCSVWTVRQRYLSSGLPYFRFKPRLCQDYDFISSLEVPGRWTVQANVATAARAWHCIGFPKDTV